MNARRTLFLAIAAAAAFAGAQTKIQRRSALEITEGANNTPGEVTYVAGQAGAVLHVGTSDLGTVHVTDPFAVHFSARRTLSGGEFALELSDGAFWASGDAVCLATNVTGSAVVTNTVSVMLADPGLVLEDVAFEREGNGHVDVVRVSASRIDIVGVTQTGVVGGVGQAGFLVVRGIVALGRDSAASGGVWDSTADTVTLVDSMGRVEVSELRGWVARRYDGRTAEDWSNHPATNVVRLGGQRIRFNEAGSLTAAFDGASATNAWSVFAYGSKVLSIVPGLQTYAPGGAFDIMAIEPGAGAVSVWVTADLGFPVYVQTRPSLSSGDWADAANQTSTYPQTEMKAGRACYRVDVPTPANATAGFFRARCTATGQNAEIRIANCDFYVMGERCAWTNITVGGVSIRVLASQEGGR